MTRIWLPLCGILLLAACEPTIPDSAAGVGFNNYQAYAAQQRVAREAQLRTPRVLSPETTGGPVATGGSGQPAISAGELAAAGINISPNDRGVIVRNPSAQAAPSRAQATPSRAGATPTDPGAPLSALRSSASNPQAATTAATPATVQAQPAVRSQARLAGISDEQDFGAVSSRQSINSDAERLARLRAQRQDLRAQLPDRPQTTGPDIVAFALQTRHGVGQKVYNRTFPSMRKAQRACATFAAPDIAQRAFLEAGGPQRDRMGIDPDGDGFACAWNPAPFRSAVQG